MRVLVVSDTHVPVLARAGAPRPGPDIIAAIPSFFFTFSLVLQAGLGYSALNAGLSIIPWSIGTAIASTASARLAPKLGKWTIGIVHGHEGIGMYTEDRAFNAFASQRVDVIVFGHSHQPMNMKRDGILMFNPGSAVAGRGGQGNTYGVLELGESVGSKIVRVT